MLRNRISALFFGLMDLYIQYKYPPMTKPRKKDEDDDLPATASANKKVLTKGFGFVWMLSKKDVERAIEGCNVVTVRAGTAETLVMKSPSRKMIPRMTIGAVIMVKTVMRAVWACLTERMRIPATLVQHKMKKKTMGNL